MSAELGVCYYPEHWPEDRWEQDAADMRTLGLTWVRIGEFAWSRIEPTSENFHWDWLDKAINVLGRAGLQVVLGTPTATPPRWMLDKYPDMLAIDARGDIRKFGSRRHYCFSHIGYRQEAVRITGILKARYQSNPYIKAWQIDNEYGCHATVLSYSRAALSAFRKWLKSRYKTIDILNTAWGNVFWSMDYTHFDQIELPNLTVTEANPIHVMDFRRFSSDQVIAFNRAQCDVLKPCRDQDLIHNYMGRITDFDHFKLGENLDIASWDSYPLGFLEDRSDQGEVFKHAYMRQGDPDFQAFHHDLYRAVGKGRWWVMEQQPGPVNWAPYNPAPLPGMVRLWTWEAIAHGAEVVSYFRWRQAPFGQENMHAGLQRPDGIAADVSAEVKKISEEVTQFLKAAGISEKTDAVSEAAIGLVFDYSSAWAWEAQPQGRDFNYFRLVYDFYRGLRRLGFSVDILPPTTKDFGDRKMVCIPGLFSWTPQLKQAMKNFKGQLVIGPRTGSKSSDYKTVENLPPDLPSLSFKVKAVETLRPSAKVCLQKGGCFHIWRELCEISSRQDSVEITEYCDDGLPAIIKQAKVSYITGWPDDIAMTRVLETIARKENLSPIYLQHGHRCRQFGQATLHMNYGLETVILETGSGGKLSLGAGDISLIDNVTKNIIG